VQRNNQSVWLSVFGLACRLSYQLAVLLTYQPGGLSAYRLIGHQTGFLNGFPNGLSTVGQAGFSTNHAANKQRYFGTCITSPASGSMLRRLAPIVRVKPLSDTALRA
jgi:hypothetical protein